MPCGRAQPVGGMVEGVEDDHLLAERGPALGGDVGEFRLRIDRQHAAAIEQQVANDHHRFAAAIPRHRQDVAIVFDPDQLVAEGADQNFSARIVGIVGERLVAVDNIRCLPARLRDGLFR